MVRMPSACSLAPALGPMPLMRRTGSGQMRVGMSASVSTVRPSGLSSSLAILDSSLLGVTPIEQVRPGGTAHVVADLLRQRTHAAGGVVAHGVLRAGHVAQVDVDLVDAAVLDHRRHLGHRGLEQARIAAVLVEVHRQQHRLRARAARPSSAHAELHAEGRARHRWRW
jgi:hypothetical protein